MKILTSGQPVPARTGVVLGAFDGIHLGHRALIEQAVRRAHGLGAPACVFTFDGPPSGAKRILSPVQRDRILEALDVDYLYVQQFDPAFRNLAPEAFLEGYLGSAVLLGAGFNFCFGKGRAGTVETLRAFGEKRGIGVFVQEAVFAGDVPVSSTGIRRAVERGDLEEARTLLGRAVCIDGTVVHGDHMGKTFGFPTANLPLPPDRLAPPDGVYATVAEAGGRRYASFTNVGGKPTIAPGRHLAETHLFNFDGDLYGAYMQVEFVKRLRDVQAFENVGALVAQLRRDKRESLKILI